MASDNQSDMFNENEHINLESAEFDRDSISSSSKSTNAVRRKSNNSLKGQEVREEDEIFFKDDQESSETCQEGMEYGHYGPVPPEQQLSSSRRRIIQEILASFDLEQVMDRYRGDSVNRSLSRQKFKTWLESVMAANEARFSDRQWNEQFTQKVLEDFERKQDEREKKLADAESQRILKLKIMGVLQDDDEGRREDETIKKTRSERKFYRRTTQKHQSLFQPTDIETQMEILNRTKQETKNRSRDQNGIGDSSSYNHENTDDNHVDVDGKNLTYKSHLGCTNANKKDEHPQLKELYEEEDLSQLYREAASLVRKTPARSK